MTFAEGGTGRSEEWKRPPDFLAQKHQLPEDESVKRLKGGAQVVVERIKRNPYHDTYEDAIKIAREFVARYRGDVSKIPKYELDSFLDKFGLRDYEDQLIQEVIGVLAESVEDGKTIN